MPFGRWWSGLATGPGVPALWAKPLLFRMDSAGRADLSVPSGAIGEDGFREAGIVPAIFLELGDSVDVAVVDSGPLHVRFRLTAPGIVLVATLVQGSPFLELEGVGELHLAIPGLAVHDSKDTTAGVDRLSTAAGDWLLAASGGPVDRIVDGDSMTIVLAAATRLAIGPVPESADEAYGRVAASVAAAPLLDTSEQITVDDYGAVRQVLRQEREVKSPQGWAWVLQPHHVDFATESLRDIGSFDSVFGPARVVRAVDLVLEYPPVPVLWDAVTPEGFAAPSVGGDDLPEIGVGSYFGGKHTATAALVHDVLVASHEFGAASRHLDSVDDSLRSLVSPNSEPTLAWDPGWGSIVISPAEFGADTELNDHHLQYAYWVAASASVAVADETRVPSKDAIDLLIADYAGAVTVPGMTGIVADEGTWSAYEGHSWASGLGGFADGNNLESISESSFAWWAAAKWFLATGRPDLAEQFIGRLTIESWITAHEWLPQAGDLPGDNVRPWTGVVWAGKTSPNTWFDPSDEAALGIRLLPLGPASFSRYPNQRAVEAARARWRWCDEKGDGCAERWWNLLDSDAAVAGLAVLEPGPQPEESTVEVVRRWWRSHWELGTVAENWMCTPGVLVRERTEGTLEVLVTNPSGEPMTVRCHDVDDKRFETTAPARTSIRLPIRQAESSGQPAEGVVVD